VDINSYFADIPMVVGPGKLAPLNYVIGNLTCLNAGYYCSTHVITLVLVDVTAVLFVVACNTYNIFVQDNPSKVGRLKLITTYD